MVELLTSIVKIILPISLLFSIVSLVLIFSKKELIYNIFQKNNTSQNIIRILLLSLIFYTFTEITEVLIMLDIIVGNLIILEDLFESFTLISFLIGFLYIGYKGIRNGS